MSYPALMEKFDTGRPVGGADMPGAEGGGGPIGGGRGGKEEGVEGGNGELLVKGEGNWEDWGGGGGQRAAESRDGGNRGEICGD